MKDLNNHEGVQIRHNKIRSNTLNDTANRTEPI